MTIYPILAALAAGVAVRFLLKDQSVGARFLVGAIAGLVVGSVVFVVMRPVVVVRPYEPAPLSQPEGQPDNSPGQTSAPTGGATPANGCFENDGQQETIVPNANGTLECNGIPGG